MSRDSTLLLIYLAPAIVPFVLAFLLARRPDRNKMDAGMDKSGPRNAKHADTPRRGEWPCLICASVGRISRWPGSTPPAAGRFPGYRRPRRFPASCEYPRGSAVLCLAGRDRKRLLFRRLCDVRFRCAGAFSDARLPALPPAGPGRLQAFPAVLPSASAGSVLQLRALH